MATQESLVYDGVMSQIRKSFASDNYASAHPAAVSAIVAANEGHAAAYGNDAWSARLSESFRKIFGEETEVFPVFNGTGANVVSLQAITRSYGAVLCSEWAHIHRDECGAPEKLAQTKLVLIPSSDAKVTVAGLESQMARVGDEHSVQPQAVSISQTTEFGTLYTPDEVRAICDWAHGHGLMVHMDGARIANAAAALGVSPRAFTRDAGVDILSFGGTKNGMVFGDAVVVLNPRLAPGLKFIRKQSMQLASKMRFVAAQFVAMLEGDLYLESARHANRMASMLAGKLEKIPGVEFNQRPQANAIFASLPPGDWSKLREEFPFYFWREEKREARLMCSWDTTDDDVCAFIAALKRVQSR